MCQPIQSSSKRFRQRVCRPHLARYYLRALEKSLKYDDQPEYVANEEVTEINLEHCLPLSPFRQLEG